MEKIRALAREILNDWDVGIAFVDYLNLSPADNDAERATPRRHCSAPQLRPRTEEGSRFYVTDLSVIEASRRRSLEVWSYAFDHIKTARAGLPHPPIAKAAAPV